MPRTHHRVPGLPLCECGTKITNGRLVGDRFMCDDCWRERERQETLNFPRWGGNNAKKGNR